MASTFKLYNSACNDGTVYIDLPISGKLTTIRWAVYVTAGAGGIGVGLAELSRVAVGQGTISNPRGVLDHAAYSTGAASTGTAVNLVRTDLSEPVKAGERLYLNTAAASNLATWSFSVYFTIE